MIDNAVNVSEYLAMHDKDNDWILEQNDGTKPVIDSITYTPDKKGTCTITDGNPNHSILFSTIQYNDPYYDAVGIYNLGKPNQPTTAKKGMDHTVAIYLGTDANGNSIATANDVIQAIKQNPDVSSIIDASLGSGSNGNWLVQPSAEQELKGKAPASIKIHFSKDMDMLMTLNFNSNTPTASNIAFGNTALGPRASGKWDDPRTFEIDPDTSTVTSGDTLTQTTFTDVFGHTVDMQHSNLTIK